MDVAVVARMTHQLTLPLLIIKLPRAEIHLFFLFTSGDVKKKRNAKQRQG